MIMRFSIVREVALWNYILRNLLQGGTPHWRGRRTKKLCKNAIHRRAGKTQINLDSASVESGLHHDFEQWLEKLAPEKPHSQYRHNGFEDNADAHLKRSVMGREVVVAVTNGDLDFGPWEQIFYGEFDGKRRKRILVKIIGE